MNILVVGNVVKDVYLNLDNRTEPFESDKNNTKWLDLSFNASKHHFFHRSTNFGGAAVSLEVLQKLGLNARINGSNLNFADDDPENDIPETVSAYRYILVNDGKTTYFTPSSLSPTVFKNPTFPVDYLYIDRSANLNRETVNKIHLFLSSSRKTKLILYLNDPLDENRNSLLPKADLVFVENKTSKKLRKLRKTPKNPENSAISDALPSEFTSVNPENSENSSVISDALSWSNLDKNKVITISENALRYLDITENISINRADVMTHLSVYSIAAATVLGCFVLGFSVENSLKLAKLNLENSRLNASLSLNELKKLKNSVNDENNLDLIAKTLVLYPKGILAADESGGSIEKKFAEAGIENSYQNRRDYRNLFFTTENLEDYVNGVILFDETARQYADNGQTFTDFLISKGIVPGIKVDGGLEKFENSEETYTKGLDGLDERLKEYYNLGLRFAKWRAAFEIRFDNAGKMTTPSDYAIHENASILAKYAKKCQNAGIVPIVEPEVVHAGYYSVEDCAFVTGKILDELFLCLAEENVDLKGCLLKTNMVLAGKKYEHQSTPKEVGHETARVLKEHIPNDLAGVVFLSGGQTVEQATDNLAEIAKNGPYPWGVTFSYARALQAPALDAWAGDNNNADKARSAFRARLIANVNALRH